MISSSSKRETNNSGSKLTKGKVGQKNLSGNKQTAKAAVPKSSVNFKMKDDALTKYLECYFDTVLKSLPPKIKVSKIIPGKIY